MGSKENIKKESQNTEQITRKRICLMDGEALLELYEFLYSHSYMRGVGEVTEFKVPEWSFYQMLGKHELKKSNILERFQEYEITLEVLYVPENELPDLKVVRDIGDSDAHRFVRMYLWLMEKKTEAEEVIAEFKHPGAGMMAISEREFLEDLATEVW